MTTFEHLTNWVWNEFYHLPASGKIQLRTEMMRIRDGDPDYWDDAGWWRVYDRLQINSAICPYHDHR